MTAIEIDNVVPFPGSKLEAALALAREGYTIFPCIPDTKKPLLKDSWQMHATRDPDTIRQWWEACPDANIARPAGNEIIVDVDVRKGGDSTLFRLQEEGLDFPETRSVRTPSGGQHLCYQLPDGVRVRQSVTDALGPGLDIKAHMGGYVLCPGSVIGEVPYVWLDHRTPTMCPDWIIERAKQKHERKPDAGKRVADEDDWTRKEVEELVANVPDASVAEGGRNAAGYKLAAKMYDLAAQHDTVLEWLIAWNERCCNPPLSQDEIEIIARSAETSRQNTIGKRHRSRTGHDLLGEENRPPEAPGLRLINPADWQGKPVPKREWVVTDWIPAGTVSMVFGDGGTGKTTLLMQLAAARALGRDWISFKATAGRTLFLSAEDEETEMHRRLDAIRRHYGAQFSDLTDMRLVDLVGENAVLGALAGDGMIHATELFNAVMKEIAAFAPDLAIIDALADAFSGDENNRTQARQFISLLKRAARDYGCTFVVLAHPSLTGLNTGRGTSGSTGWNNSVRARMYLTAAQASDGSVPDPDLRTFALPKANSSRNGATVNLRWSAGVYVPWGVGNLDQMAIEQSDDEAFLVLLKQFNAQGRDVSPNPCRIYAPTLFAAEIDGKAIGAKRLTSAMSRLLGVDKIHVETSGPTSKPRARLIAGGAK